MSASKGAIKEMEPNLSELLTVLRQAGSLSVCRSVSLCLPACLSLEVQYTSSVLRPPSGPVPTSLAFPRDNEARTVDATYPYFRASWLVGPVWTSTGVEEDGDDKEVEEPPRDLYRSDLVPPSLHEGLYAVCAPCPEVAPSAVGRDAVVVAAKVALRELVVGCGCGWEWESESGSCVQEKTQRRERVREYGGWVRGRERGRQSMSEKSGHKVAAACCDSLVSPLHAVLSSPHHPPTSISPQVNSTMSDSFDRSTSQYSSLSCSARLNTLLHLSLTLLSDCR